VIVETVTLEMVGGLVSTAGQEPPPPPPQEGQSGHSDSSAAIVVNEYPLVPPLSKAWLSFASMDLTRNNMLFPPLSH